MKKKVIFIDSVHEILWFRLEEMGFECIDATKSTEILIKSELIDAFGIVIRARFQLNEEFLKDYHQLKFIARSGSGLENIDLEFCKRKNIFVFNSPEGNRNAVAEHGLGMLLSLLNKIPKADNEVRQGIWNREDNRGIELDGKTIGIIGYGNNGSAFAKKLRGFDCNILAHDKYKNSFSNDQVKECSIHELYENADVISFHIPQNTETIYMFDDSFVESMEKPFYLLNVSRGKIVKTSSLVRGFKTGKILGACLDVLEYEPASFSTFFNGEIPEDLNYLLKSDRVIFSPHVAGWTEESYLKLSSVLADKIQEAFQL